MIPKRLLRLSLLVVLVMSETGCSVRRYAINKIGDALASGGSTYESDDDIQLVGEALPFGLKLIESLLAESPDHQGLLMAACQGFTTYAYVYVQRDADKIADDDIQAANAHPCPCPSAVPARTPVRHARNRGRASGHQ